jgi:hypothetical protein
MGSSFDANTLFALASIVVGLTTMVFYTRDILTGKTKPHEFTWLIWVVTQGTATAVMWYGGGGKGAWMFTVGTFFVFAVFLLLLFRGSRNITKSDITVLILALTGMGLWWLLSNPLLTVILMTAIDVFGYIPTFRKCYSSPRSEDARYWVLFALANTLSICALESYNVLTLTYLVSITSANVSLALFLVWRRRVVLYERSGIDKK